MTNEAAISSLVGEFSNAFRDAALSSVIKYVWRSVPRFNRQEPYIAMCICMWEGFYAVTGEKAESRQMVVEKLLDDPGPYNEYYIKEIYYDITGERMSDEQLKIYHAVFFRKAAKNQELSNFISIQSTMAPNGTIMFPTDRKVSIRMEYAKAWLKGLVAVCILLVSLFLIYYSNRNKVDSYISSLLGGNRASVELTPTPELVDMPVVIATVESTPEIVTALVETVIPTFAPEPSKPAPSYSQELDMQQGTNEPLPAFIQSTYEIVPSVEVTYAPTLLTFPQNTLDSPIFVPELKKVEGIKFSFATSDIKADEAIDVYSAPSKQSYRGKSKSGSKAKVSTKGTVWYAGYVGKWLLIKYGTNDGTDRVGYIRTENVRDLPSGDVLNFQGVSVMVISDAEFTDDPSGTAKPLRTIKVGETVEYLGYYGSLAYIETAVDGKTARGFVDRNCLGVK